MNNSLVSKINILLEKKPVILQVLRFFAIGVINTALDFAILNFVSTYLGIHAGAKLGGINVIGFTLAVVQSYFWNKYWAFSGTGVGLVKNLARLVSVGFLGFVVFVMVVAGAKFQAGSIYYFSAFALLVVGQLGVWYGQGISHEARPANGGVQFASFIAVSLVGLVINSALLALFSYVIEINGFLSNDPELVKNIAKLIATVASLVWNFIGYKLFVFKK